VATRIPVYPTHSMRLPCTSLSSSVSKTNAAVDYMPRPLGSSMKKIRSLMTHTGFSLHRVIVVTLAFSGCSPSVGAERHAPAVATPAPTIRDAPALATPAAPQAATPSAAEILEDDNREPLPIRIHDAKVIAEIQADNGDYKGFGSFDVIPFDDRIWVLACSVKPIGCSRPQLRELDKQRWTSPRAGLNGLASLGVVNLYALRDLPYKKWVSHEENRPLSSPRAQCRYDNLMWGSREIGGTRGTFPGHAWLVVRTSLSHSGLPTDELYHWKGGQWRRALGAEQYGDTIIDAVPWAEGIAVARRRGYWDAFAYDLLYVTDQTRVPLLPSQKADLQLMVHEQALFALEGAYSNDIESSVVNLRVLRWSTPGSSVEPHALSLAHGENATSLVAKMGSPIEITWKEPEPRPIKAKTATIALTGNFQPSIETATVDSLNAPDIIIQLPAPYAGEASPETTWHVRGRDFWLVRVEEPSNKYLLLSNLPAALWTPSVLIVPELAVHQCDAQPERSGKSSNDLYD
jgi:hypothetical protein